MQWVHGVEALAPAQEFNFVQWIVYCNFAQLFDNYTRDGIDIYMLTCYFLKTTISWGLRNYHIYIPGNETEWCIDKKKTRPSQLNNIRICSCLTFRLGQLVCPASSARSVIKINTFPVWNSGNKHSPSCSCSLCRPGSNPNMRLGRNHFVLNNPWKPSTQPHKD